MLKIARIAIKKNAAFSDCIVVFGVKPYIIALTYLFWLVVYHVYQQYGVSDHSILFGSLDLFSDHQDPYRLWDY